MNKLYENEQLFAEVNAKTTKAIAGIAPSDFPEDFVIDLYCECANKKCFDRIKVKLAEYAKAKDKTSFFVTPEHILLEFETLLKKTMNYWIIRKKMEKIHKDFEV